MVCHFDFEDFCVWFRQNIIEGQLQSAVRDAKAQEEMNDRDGHIQGLPMSLHMEDLPFLREKKIDEYPYPLQSLHD